MQIDSISIFRWGTMSQHRVSTQYCALKERAIWCFELFNHWSLHLGNSNTRLLLISY